MILFMLKCPSDHRFEGWFKDGAAYERQAKRRLIACPVCESSEISKAPMAPRISKGLARNEEAAPLAPPQDSIPTPPVPAQEATLPASPELLTALRDVVEKHCENVGSRFAEEARRIHYGESEARGIYGQTDPEETKALLEEGIDILPLPWPTRNA
ncbi:MAG: DUF1178 family protein [Alphaproteobacteria bacterium]|nr:DUF1178 family protein [Alphaproteobacteria bacterium]